MKRIQSITACALLTGSVILGLAGCATHESSMQTSASTAYPLTKCVVSGEDLGDHPYVFTHNGQTVKLCCKDCQAKFDQEPEKYMAKITPAK
jgi:YHS domain-containing protein